MQPMTAKQAALYLQGFNEEMLAQPRGLWAIPVPVRIVYQCRVTAGGTVTRGKTDLSPWATGN
jgi:hypothetical protein